MAARGDVSREAKPATDVFAQTLPGALGMGDLDFSRENTPVTGGSGGTPGPVIPTYGQIFPRGRG